ncbi:MAG: DUF378 domain-containing protein [Candidatus Moranbacteria bacterium]|nr:DUF378 domain-containing protein [Candidatus Moranbacteria bacterium]
MYSIALALLIIGGINMGLIGFLDKNLIAYLLAGYPLIEQIIYMAVGVATISVMFNWRHYR